jgi:hypothetical protein
VNGTKLLYELAKLLGVSVINFFTDWTTKRITGKAGKAAKLDQLREIESSISELEKGLAKSQEQAERVSRYLALWLTVLLIWCTVLTCFVVVLVFKCLLH